VAASDRVVACLKHYVGYGAAEGGRDYNTTDISDYTLWNFYLPQFKAGIDAGAWTVMSAFNCLSGVPASGNKYTLTDILRTDWKFRGFVVSDYESVSELINHGVAASEADAARIALTAGVDMEMISKTYPDTLKQQVEQGTVLRKVVDEAVRRVLRVKFEKGLFDHPFTDESLYHTAYLQSDALALSREAAAESCVLLKDENGALPLSPSRRKIALIGPLADAAQELVGPWHSRAHADDLTSLAEAMRNAAGSDFEISVARGCALVEPGVVKVPRNITDFQPLKEHSTSPSEISDAVSLAKSSDVVVLAVGEPLDWSGEDGSRSDLGLPGMQQPLFDALAATGKPVVVVLFNGRPLAIPEIQQKAAAILEAWFPGTQGANGVADILFGKADPSGRLTTTFPRAVGQVPFYYNHYNTGRPGFGEYKGNYVDIPTTPLYPFGHGLAYTSFEFGNVALAANKVPLRGVLNARIEIKNTGQRDGTAVPELYIRALAATAGARPVRELKGFQKILLQPGESRVVNIELPAHDLGCYDATGRWLVEPGKYQLWISRDSASGDPISFELEK
jgi:beta-glucosidase